MLKSIRRTVTVALVASAGISGVAFASGEYYNGVSAEPAASVDLFQTSGIDAAAPGMRAEARLVATTQSVDHGDYYTGATRPQ